MKETIKWNVAALGRKKDQTEQVDPDGEILVGAKSYPAGPALEAWTAAKLISGVKGGKGGKSAASD